ncbi:2-succinylbenzoate--CoA ligase, chloroplastic/peroxisomal [Carica papaya]|uniref:2-succinylbenzoate--CoA ligase, chloroplastic/peroxisomal n=1 Tax=Carica papaya TaxID=3649 RepID=UPI000B8C781B|nr:2-succinylbenzoate--CoA ligase, chloroplastic/peroxisomal [Carica papaya]
MQKPELSMSLLTPERNHREFPNYPPPEMGYYSQAHICQCLTRLSTLKRNSIVTFSGHRKKTGHEFVRSVLSLAGGLLKLGVRNGDVVAISAFNSDWYLEWLLAVSFVGGVVAPLNYRWSFEEARSAMLTVEPVMLVTDECCSFWNLEIRNNAIASLRWNVSLVSNDLDGRKNSPLSQLLPLLTMEMVKEHCERRLPSTYSWAPDGSAIICFTSGTTGRPKGVTISHSALIVQSLAKIAIVGYGEDDVYLHTAPLCHIGGLSSAMAMLMVGARHIFTPKFDAKFALQAIEQHHVTSLITVPAIMADLISIIRKNKDWTTKESVKKILNGGGGLSRELIKDVTNIFPRAKLLSAYGMTETCSSLTFLNLWDPTLKTTDLLLFYTEKLNSIDHPQGVCVGKPAPHIELKISTDGTSQAGRILTRGPHVMLGYWGESQEKKSNAAVEGWLDTGDIGSINESGNLWLVGRSNGRIKSGGENVYPEEVKTILLHIPALLLL